MRLPTCHPKLRAVIRIYLGAILLSTVIMLLILVTGIAVTFSRSSGKSLRCLPVDADVIDSPRLQSAVGGASELTRVRYSSLLSSTVSGRSVPCALCHVKKNNAVSYIFSPVGAGCVHFGQLKIFTYITLTYTCKLARALSSFHKVFV